MSLLLGALCWLASLQRVCPQCSPSASGFRLRGRYLLGGLFDVHSSSISVVPDRPAAAECSSYPFHLSGFRKLQVMRFAVQEINNSTLLLPNVSLGYEVLDHCTDILNFPGVLNLMSANGTVQLNGRVNKYLSKVIGVIGPSGSKSTLAVAPLFSMSLLPIVSYDSSIFSLSENTKYPSFVRTNPSSKDTIQLIVHILKHFDWSWIAFLYSNDVYSKDGLEQFQRQIRDTNICLPYIQQLDMKTDHQKIFGSIDELKINVIIVFTLKQYAVTLVETVVRLNYVNRVWLAGDDWSLHQTLAKTSGISRIGTVIGVAAMVKPLPGFIDFIYQQTNNFSSSSLKDDVCNQNRPLCDGLSPDVVMGELPFNTFPVYAAVYAMANALHKVLHCDRQGCRDNITVYPYMILQEVRKSNFTLVNRNVQFDANGDPKAALFDIVFWNESGYVTTVGFFETQPRQRFFIKSTKMHWYRNGTVPLSLCSKECMPGYVRKYNGLHRCCFECEACPNGTYSNATVDAEHCLHCMNTEWSDPGSSACSSRSVMYVPHDHPAGVLVLLSASSMLALTLATAGLFAYSYNTPVVKSAGGPACFLCLACLALSTVSAYFYVGIPTPVSCVLNSVPFQMFYTVCLALFAVRSFQIVCIFKMAAKFPRVYRWWVTHNGQWLFIAVAFISQAFVMLALYTCKPPKPFNDTYAYKDQIILRCNFSCTKLCAMLVPLVLSILSFSFSYMGKDLPKNYNEAKVVTFSLLILMISWITFATVSSLYAGKYIEVVSATVVLCSLYCIMLCYFLPKCYIIVFQPQRNTQKYFQGLIQSYTKNISKG